MALPVRERFVHWQIAWMLGTILALSLLGELTVKQFFLVSLVGFLIIVEFLVPVNVTPRWRRRLRWFVLLGLLGFGYVVVTVFLDMFREIGIGL